jgi:hypothetical protein
MAEIFADRARARGDDGSEVEGSTMERAPSDSRASSAEALTKHDIEAAPEYRSVEQLAS